MKRTLSVLLSLMLAFTASTFTGCEISRQTRSSPMTVRARAGDRNAQYDLAVHYLYDRHDPVTALRWFRRAAEQGHALAQFNLGLGLYHRNEDKREALRWLRRARAQGVKAADDPIMQLEAYLKAE